MKKEGGSLLAMPVDLQSHMLAGNPPSAIAPLAMIRPTVPPSVKRIS